MSASPAQYIQHHLLHWQWSPSGNVSGFWTFNVDTILISIICGLLFFGIFRYAAIKATVDNPGRLQLLVESVILMVEEQTTSVLNERDVSVSSLALSIFVWVWLMNFMDLIPVDLIPVIVSHLGVPVFRAVPTADLSLTFALSLSVLVIVIYEGIKAHGIKEFLWEVFAHPFTIYCFPANVMFRIIEELTKPLSLSLRLFGNMFAGELIFFLIALTPFYIQWVVGLAWLGLHVFIITLQAFIFMILTIVYIGMARNEH